MCGLCSDNGSEFINQHLYNNYCQQNRITFTRSHSYRKNDSCHLEQKNWPVLLRLIGYDRYKSRAALETLNRIYIITNLYINLFPAGDEADKQATIIVLGVRYKVYDPIKQ